MNEVKRGRGRPRKPDGAMSATERSRLYRQRQQEERERLEAELEYVRGFAEDGGQVDDGEDAPVDESQSTSVSEEVERLRERDRRWQGESHDLAVVIVKLLNRLAQFDLTTAQDCLADPFVSRILTRWRLYTPPEPQAFNRNHDGGFAQSDVVGALTTKSANRLESLVVVPEGDKTKD